jgi:glutamate-1-semialdehyde aminotransferase
MYKQSTAHINTAKKLIPGGCSTESKKPEALFASENAPAFYLKAEGARLTDMDNNDFIDFGMALGACLLGYNHPAVNEAMKAEMEKGILTTLPTCLEAQLAEIIIDTVPSIEMVRFMKTGAEGVSAAVRLARACTGRKYVLTSGYFGWHDWFSKGMGVPDAIKELCVPFVFNDKEDFHDKLNSISELPAAIVMEPVINGHPEPGFLKMLRDHCDNSGAILIWDETKTAFRMAPGGAQQYYNFIPDLTVMGKAIAGGMPLTAVGGKKEIMESWHKVWISSTYACESLSLAAAYAVLNFVRKNKVHLYIQKLGTKLLKGSQQIAGSFPELCEVFGIPHMSGIKLKEELPDIQKKEATFYKSILDSGYIIKRKGYNFVSFAHKDEHIDGCLDAVDKALKKLNS